MRKLSDAMKPFFKTASVTKLTGEFMISIEIWSDVNCPFCYIGKRYLEQALNQFSHKDQVEIEWKSFELDPETIPDKNVSHEQLLAEKYGKDILWAKQMDDEVTQMAKRVGLEFHMDKIIPANSFNAHRLLHLAKTYKIQNDLKEKLLAAKFVEGKDIDNNDVLKGIALDLGIDREEVERTLESNRFEREVHRDEELAGALGISAVPFFVFNKQVAFSGAQPIETFLEVLYSLEEGQNKSWP